MRTEGQSFSPERGRSGESDRINRLRKRIDAGIASMDAAHQHMKEELKTAHEKGNKVGEQWFLRQATYFAGRASHLRYWREQIRPGADMETLEARIEKFLSETPPMQEQEAGSPALDSARAA